MNENANANLRNKGCLKIILDIAKRVGIDEVGFTKITNFEYMRRDLEDRIEAGNYCDFELDDISLRITTDSVMKECKTIIAFAFPYFKGSAYENRRGYGRICASSVGVDYHVDIKTKIDQFVLELENKFEFKSEICIDSYYLLDKEICKNANLGFIGKNSLLINPKYGSFVFLGYVLTDIDIPQEIIDEYNLTRPLVGSCGDCHACIRGCPNQAISNEGRVDVHKCLSNLTQTKEEIPKEYRKAMGSQIYGCDQCQLNCPKNIAIYGEYHINENLYVPFEEILDMSNREFKSKYAHLAAAWRGKNIWKRNALIAIANQNISELEEKVKNCTKSDSKLVSDYAIYCLEELERKKLEEKR